MPNIITAPRFEKNTAVLVKTEGASYGVDSTPSGAANWIEARNLQFNPYDAETQDRNIVFPWMGAAGKTVVSQWGKLTFDFLCAGAGAAGSAPKWSPFALGGGFAETISVGVSAVYNLVSSGFGSNTCWINKDGVYHKLIGGRNELKFKGMAKGIPVFSAEIDCLYVGPVAGALPAVTRTGWGVDEGVNSVNTTKLTINAIDFAFQELNWALGNKLARINLPGPQLEVAITDRAPSLDTTVLAPPLATFDPFALATAGTNVAATVTHGSAAGKKVTMAFKLVLTNVDYATVDGMLGYKLVFEPTPVSGNDEITITVL